MVWSEGPSHTSNFDRYDNYDIPGCDYAYVSFGGSKTGDFNTIVELMATIANQDDKTIGFQVDTDCRGNPKGGWLHHNINPGACQGRQCSPGDSKGNSNEIYLRRANCQIMFLKIGRAHV